jgi:hypothetical protein
MKKKTPTYFAFETSLSAKQLFDRLPEALREYNAINPESWGDLRWEIPGESKNRFRIGIERAGHSNGGYWYCATIEETETGSRITGNVVFNPDENDISQGSKETLWDKIQSVLLFVLLLIPIILLQIGFRIYKWIRHIPKELSKEGLLVHFMTKHLSCRLTEQR